MEKYKHIAKHYEECFEQHGNNCRGVDWPNVKDAETRYRIMLELIPPSSETCSLLDFGCGLSHLYDYMRKDVKYDNIIYTGLDISEKFVDFSKEKGPRYLIKDLIREDLDEYFDYIVFNGVFTEKLDLSEDEMFAFMEQILLKCFKFTKKGLAFNVMSKNVDWERQDLFHCSMDKLTNFLFKNGLKHFVIRNDYGLYEYTTYVYRDVQ